MKVLFYCILITFLFSAKQTNAQTHHHNKDTTRKPILNPNAATVRDTNTYFYFPGTTVKIKPPMHFVAYKKINGFIHPGSSSTIQVTEIPEIPYVMYTKGLTASYFEKQGVKLISELDVTTTKNKPGKMYIVSFSSNGVEFERIMLFTGDYNHTIWINANYPVMVKFLLFDALKRSVLTVDAEK